MSFRVCRGLVAIATAITIVGCSREPAPAAETGTRVKRTVSKRDFPELRPAASTRGTKKVAASKPGVRRVAVVKATAPAAITAAGPVNGTLARADERLADGSFVDFFTYAGTRGERVTITMRSKEFDAYLIVGAMRNGVFEPQGEDDDSGGNTDARLELTLESTAPILIAANALAEGATGAYTLEVSRGAGATPAGGAAPGGGSIPRGEELRAGATANGQLETTDRLLPSDKTHYDEWFFEGRSGQRVVITMRSDAFDPYLILMRGTPGSGDLIDEDDDSGGGLIAQLTTTLPEDGVYTVLANSVDPGTGAYSLMMEIGAAPAPNTDSAGVPYSERYPGNGNPADKYALVVGISDYPGTDSDLNGPVEDARLFQQLLVGRFGFKPENVVMLNNENATREHILNAFVRHLGQAGPQGTAVFFYSGHGTQLPENLALTAPIDPETGDGRDEALYVWGTNRRSSIILDDEIGYLIDQLKTDRVLLVHDSCNSGTSARAASPTGQPKEVLFSRAVADASFMPRKFAVAAPPPNEKRAASAALVDVLDVQARYGLLAGSQDTELSYTAMGWPDKGGVASVFTYYLVSTLETADEGMTFNQVMDKVRALTTAYTQTTYKETQTPQISGTIGTRTIGSILR